MLIHASELALENQAVAETAIVGFSLNPMRLTTIPTAQKYQESKSRVDRSVQLCARELHHAKWVLEGDGQDQEQQGVRQGAGNRGGDIGGGETRRRKSE